MLKTIVLVGLLLAAAVVFGLWRGGFLDEDAVKDKAAELGRSAEKNVKRAGEEAAKAAREAVQK